MKKTLALGLLIALCIVTSPVWAAEINTDKTIYSPGDTVLISGSGFTSGSEIDIILTVTDPVSVPYSWTVESNDGTFTTSYYLSGYEGTFVVNAMDSAGVSAETTFYDPPPIEVVTTITLDAIASPLTAGQTGVTFSGVVSNASYSIPDGMNVQLQNSMDGTNFYTIITVQTSGETGSYSGTFTAPSSPGTYYYRAHFPGAGNLEGYKYDESKSTLQTITVNPSTPTNSPPVIGADNPTVTVNEGDTATNTGTWSDADAGDTVTLSASIGTVTKSGTNDDGTWSWSFATTDGPAQSQTVTITADDGHTTTSATFGLTVENVDPTVGAIVIPTDPIQIGVAVPVSVSFTDPGTADTHTAVWNWDDSSTSVGSVTETDGSGSVTGSHTYSTPGIYTISVTVTDKDGGVGTSIASTYIVIYDPNGGFVTGGGWINSPIGAYLADPTMTGKANFGFVSKYQKGANTPVGETEFQFKAGDLNFHSSSYDWLVVAGTKAIYKGTGTINGAGNYGFLLSAIDGSKGSPDKFRIKIWDKDPGDGVVYDNQVSGDKTDNADPTTTIAGGSIVVHK
jgi:hypothetical protein